MDGHCVGELELEHGVLCRGSGRTDGSLGKEEGREI